MADAKYPLYDHDLHGHVTPDVVPGRVYHDAAAGRIVCSVHGDACATDGSRKRPATEAVQVGVNDEGIALFDHENAKPVGEARLYRCTVCGQGTWSHLA